MSESQTAAGELLSFPETNSAAWDHGESGDTGDRTYPQTTPLDGSVRDLIMQTRGMAPDLAGDALTWHLASLDTVLRTSFVSLGMLCREVRDRQLWKLQMDPETMQPFHSMSAWIVRSAPYSYRHCHSAMTALDELSDIPVEKLAEVKPCNISQLLRMSTAVRQDPEVLESASKLSEVAFANMVAEKHPLQHIERTHKVTWKLPASVLSLLDRAIERAMLREGCTTREEALESIFVSYLQ